MADDDREVGQLIVMLVTLHLELCRVLTFAPAPSLEKQMEWMDRLMQDIQERYPMYAPPPRDSPAPSAAPMRFPFLTNARSLCCQTGFALPCFTFT
jgi:hypothetical protein